MDIDINPQESFTRFVSNTNLSSMMVAMISPAVFGNHTTNCRIRRDPFHDVLFVSHHP